MTHPALRYRRTIRTAVAEYFLELWGKRDSGEKHRTKSSELHLLRQYHPALCCGLPEQVHGNDILELSPDHTAADLGVADAVLTRHENVLCCVRTADCIPLLGFSEEIPLCFAIHAGWRGLQSEIITATVRKTADNYGIRPSSLKIFIGPHILRDSYETGKEVWGHFAPCYTQTTGDKGYLDLTAIARDQLLDSGISCENITGDPENTLGSDIFFSHRGGDSGRNLNVIYMKY